MTKRRPPKRRSVNDPHTPKDQLAAARKRLKRERSKKRPPDVLARYEREVQRLTAWVKIGAPVSPAFVSFSALDPLTQATLIGALARDTKGQPDPVTAVQMTAADAVVSLKWPGINAPVSVGAGGEASAGAEWNRTSLVLDGLVHRLVFELVPPRGDDKPKLEDALTELADDNNWTIAQAKRHVILGALADAMVYAKQQWRRRIGATRKGNVYVSAIPDDADIIGYLKWLQQVVPDYARQQLLHYLRPDPDEEGDWPMDATGELREFDRSLFGDPNEEEPEEDSGSDIYYLRLAQGVATFTERELLVFLAEMPPALFSFAERVCERAGLILSTEHHHILNTDCASAREICAATGIPAASVPVYGNAYPAKLTTATGGVWTRKTWKQETRKAL